jgi:prolipoprotein diacylglyceryltransferase
MMFDADFYNFIFWLVTTVVAGAVLVYFANNGGATPA